MPQHLVDEMLRFKANGMVESAHARIGEATNNAKLEVNGGTLLVQADLAALKEAWQKTLRW